MIPISYKLHIEQDAFYVVPNQNTNEVIVIDRLSEEVSYQKKSTKELGGTVYAIYGIWGMIKLISGHFLIVIKSVKLIGKLNNHEIYQVTESQIIPISRSNRHINDPQILLEKEYLQMLEQLLASGGFYFSPTGDITHTFSRMENVSPDFYQNSLLERADERFVWNRHLLGNFVQSQELQKFALPIMYGYIGMVQNQLSRSTSPFQIWLISRRSTLRAGTRYYSRGSDSVGNVSNYVETEQILMVNEEILSFVQTRGSIPLIWHQKPNMYYKPNPVILGTEEEQIRILSEHFNSQVFSYHYGKQIVVNLLNQSGSEKPLGSMFSRIINEASLANVKYVPFDFHHVCRKMRWDKLSILIDSLLPHLEEIGYTYISNKKGAKEVKHLQRGVIRTNCIDCLDRTNVVQSLVSWGVLESMLMNPAIGVLQPISNSANAGNALSNYAKTTPGALLSHTGPELYYQYRNLWADNGDALAFQYTGTGALKSDYTRSGKRSSNGLIQDGYKSAVRYVLNNFRDGFRQDAIDLFLGNYVVDSLEGSSPSRLSPLQKPKSLKYKVIPWVIVIALSMLILRALFPVGDWSNNIIQILLLLTLLIFCITIIFNSGYEFVDSPRLKKED